MRPKHANARRRCQRTMNEALLNGRSPDEAGTQAIVTNSLNANMSRDLRRYFNKHKRFT